MKKTSLALAALAASAGTAFAADAYAPVRPYAGAPIISRSRPVASIESFSTEFGARYYLSGGKNAYTLGDGRGGTVSKLTFTLGPTHSGELYGKVKHLSGLYAKAAAGLSAEVSGGHLNDEDFPASGLGYSNTVSAQRDGRLGYANVDLGYAFSPVGRLEIGPFVGYQFLQETNHAFGCTQTQPNPLICPPGSVQPGERVITDKQTWNGVRVGLAGAAYVAPNVRLGAEAAYLPYVALDASDTHHLRQLSLYGNAVCAANPGACFDGATPAPGRGQGMQFEARADYFIARNWTIGVGGRYWDMWAKGDARFDVSAVPAGLYHPQPVGYRSERYGGFVNSALKF